MNIGTLASDDTLNVTAADIASALEWLLLWGSIADVGSSNNAVSRHLHRVQFTCASCQLATAVQSLLHDHAIMLLSPTQFNSYREHLTRQLQGTHADFAMDNLPS